MIFSPVILLPSLEMTAAMAHPEGIRTWPSILMQIHSFPENKKALIFAQVRLCGNERLCPFAGIVRRFLRFVKHFSQKVNFFA
jgi:hypothetical protein